jgi:transcription elongation factor GreA
MNCNKIFMKKSYIITKEGLEEARKKLKELEERLRNVLSQKGEAYQIGGDGWHDNFTFEQLIRQEEALRFQISELKAFLRKAKIIKERVSGKRVGIGSAVTLLFDDGKQLEYKIVGLMQSNPQKNYISYESPLGAAILGAKQGEKRKFIAGGKQKSAKVMDIK